VPGQSNPFPHLLQWQFSRLVGIAYSILSCCEFLFQRHGKSIPCRVFEMFLDATSDVPLAVYLQYRSSCMAQLT
jgi:hypothetical protein